MISRLEKRQVFISYAKEDSKSALRLYAALKDRGLSPWLDVESIKPGENWRNAIELAIRNSGYFIILLSTNSVSKKGFVQKELKIALDILDEYPEDEIFIIPIRIDECHPRHNRLLTLHWVDLFQSWEKGINRILETLFSNQDRAVEGGETSLITFSFINNTEPKIRPETWQDDINAITGMFTASLLMKNGFKTILIQRPLTYGELLEQSCKGQKTLTNRIPSSFVAHQKWFDKILLQYEPTQPSIKTRAIIDRDDLEDWVWEAPKNRRGIRQILVTNVREGEQRNKYDKEWGGYYSEFADPANAMLVTTNHSPREEEVTNIFSIPNQMKLCIDDKTVFDTPTSKLQFDHEYAVGAMMSPSDTYTKWVAFYNILTTIDIIRYTKSRSVRASSSKRR